MINFADYSLLLIFAVSAVVILAASEAGRRLGMHAVESGGNNISTLESAILGLLALMIGFTFAMALSLYMARHDAVVKEANAIGTTALRARLLPSPHATEVLALLREYTQIRLSVADRVPSSAEMAAATTQSKALSDALWLQAKAVAATDNAMVPTGVFIQSLNELIDMREARMAAERNRVPNIVLLALYGVAVTAAVFTGYAGAFEAQRSRPLVYAIGILVAGVILLIQDLDQPNRGSIAVSQQPMIDTAASLAGYAD